MERISEKMEGADMMLVTSLDDIAWILNLRGNDIKYNPVFFSYLMIHNKKNREPRSIKCDLFITSCKVDDLDVSNYLKSNNVTVYNYYGLEN